MNTEQLAAHLGIKAQSIRSRLCRTGSYYGERVRADRILTHPAD
jgi:hypothetical protein